MPSKIHLICKGFAGVVNIDKSAAIYESGPWLLSPTEQDVLKGGEVLLHETKARLSYFGGTILDLRPAPGATEEDGRLRCVLVVQSTAAGKNVPWDKSGVSRGVLWSSGVIELA